MLQEHEKDFYQFVGNRVRIAREEHGLTIDECAKALGLHSPVVLHRYEKGDRKIPIHLLPALSRLFKKESSYFLSIFAGDSDNEEFDHADAKFGDATIKLTYLLRRPLILAHSILSNVRDLYGHIPQNLLNEHIESGIVAVENADLICGGISKIIEIEQGKRPKFEPVPIDVHREVKRLCKSIKTTAGRSDLTIRHFLGRPIIRMDLESFQYGLFVLIDNAFKYCDPGTRISVTCDTEQSRGRYLVKIESFGLPIEPSQERLVFEKFWRHPQASQYDETGIGLGCWAAKKHMELQGGGITLKTKGKLSTFTIRCPIPLA